MSLAPVDERVSLEHPPSPRQTPMRVVTFALAVAVVAAFVLNAAVWQHLTRGPALALAPLKDVRGVVLIWILLLAMTLASRRFWTCTAAVLSVAALFATITVLKLAYLGEPLVPSDVEYLRTPGFALDMVPWWAVPLALTAMVVAVRSGWRLDRRSTMLAGFGGARALRISAAAVVVAVLVLGVTFNRTGNPMRWVFDHTGRWVMLNNASNMLTAGWVGGFLAGMPATPMARPQGYDLETMRHVEATYSTLAASANASRSGGVRPNVVVVLSESFADPTTLEGVELDRDPLAAYREVAASTSHGRTRAAAFGTGTSSMEFQALTGQSVSMFATSAFSPYQSFVADLDSYPSMVSFLAGRGYETVAIHPFSGRGYKRKDVYRTLGFDRFIDIDSIAHADRIGENEFISDASAFAELTDQIARSDAPILANVVTMQNHTPYPEHTYADPVGAAGPAGDDPAMGQWARGLEYSSDAVVKLLDELAGSNEPTAVVFYGDHFPTAFRTELAGGGETVLETPSFVWSNYSDLGDTDYGIVGPQYLAPLLFDGLAQPEPGMFALLDRMRDTVGTPTAQGFLTREGTLLKREDLTAEQREVLHDYELVQYDLSAGAGHASGLWTIP